MDVPNSYYYTSDGYNRLVTIDDYEKILSDMGIPKLFTKIIVDDNNALNIYVPEQYVYEVRKMIVNKQIGLQFVINVNKWEEL